MQLHQTGLENTVIWLLAESQMKVAADLGICENEKQLAASVQTCPPDFRDKLQIPVRLGEQASSHGFLLRTHTKQTKLM